MNSRQLPPVEGVVRAGGLEEALRQLGSEDGLERERARRLVVAIGQAAVPGLIDGLKSPNESLRWEAAKALTAVRDARAVPALVDALEDEDGGIRWLAAEGLCGIGRMALEPLLRALVNRADSIWLREGAHHVLRDLARRDLAAIVQPVITELESDATHIGVIPAADRALRQLEDAERMA